LVNLLRQSLIARSQAQKKFGIHQVSQLAKINLLKQEAHVQHAMTIADHQEMIVHVAKSVSAETSVHVAMKDPCAVTDLNARAETIVSSAKSDHVVMTIHVATAHQSAPSVYLDVNELNQSVRLEQNVHNVQFALNEWNAWNVHQESKNQNAMLLTKN
jgi:hypothetical protein